MTDEKCVLCDSTDEVQNHHISYNPEVKVSLCRKCHQKEHGNKHGTGPSKRNTNLSMYKCVNLPMSRQSRIRAKYEKVQINGKVDLVCNSKINHFIHHSVNLIDTMAQLITDNKNRTLILPLKLNLSDESIIILCSPNSKFFSDNFEVYA
jgi:hypothetical protein